MFLKKAMFITCALAVLSLVVCGSSFSYEVPYDNSNVRYFYVFGKDGDQLMGAEDNEFELVVDVPADDPNDVTISVYDPDTGDTRDWRVPGSKWNTICEYSVHGKDLLDKKEFGEDHAYDRRYYRFGPYPKEKGEKVGNYYRFRLKVKGLSGDDENLFKVKVTPESAQAFSENITIRLLPDEGAQMFFYPRVPAGTGSVIVDNYDLDATGGTSTLSVTKISEKFPIKDSKSGQWSETVVPISTDTEGRIVYVITKGTQRYANAGLRMKTDKGKTIPIYFREGAPPASKKAAPAPRRPSPEPAPKPEMKCNKFTFDATSSYDVDKQSLSYLWDFGDGETSTEPVVTHIYEKGGEYNVRLTVTDDSGLPCDTAMTSQKVYVNTAPKAAFSAPEKVCVDTNINFDASATRDDTPKNLTYMWNFGDGSRADGEQVSHKYTRGGTYNVLLTVDDNANTPCSLDSAQKTIKVNSAPTARAGKDITLCLKSLDEDYNIVFDGSGSSDPDGDTLNYMWNFGDGSTASGKRVTHTYAKGGVYKASLTVDDGSGLPCSSSSDTIKVDLNKPPMAVAGNDIKACVGSSVSFDGSASKTEPGEKLTYKWSFGDGETAEGARVSHTYEKGGRQTVLLTVDDGRGTPCSASVSSLAVDVNSRPTAALKDVGDTCVGQKIYFDASGSRDPDGDTLKYMWNFGDGNREDGSSRASHTYEKGGTYNVSVAVDDGRDSPCSTSSDAIKLKVNTPPVADLKSTKACCVDMDQKFDASGSSDADGDRLSYKWDLGDGTTAEGPSVTHAYAEPGTYKVVLMVDDGSGTPCSSDMKMEHIVVNAKPVAVIKIK